MKIDGDVSYRYYQTSCWTWYQQPQPKTPKEGVEMKGFYELYLVYGENRKDPIIHTARVIAASEGDAKIKSGLMPLIGKEWDADYVTFIARKLFDVRVKDKPKEVKQV